MADTFTKFDYLLNAFEQASQHANPASVGYGDKRRALYAYVRDLEARAERAEAAQRVPDGWRLVPDSATHRMLNAANTGRKKGCSSSGAIYAAMLAAAPDAPQAAQRVPLTEETEFEVWQDDELQASALGPRAYAWQEALRYAAQYAKDGVVRVFEVSRREVGITATEPKGEQP